MQQATESSFIKTGAGNERFNDGDGWMGGQLLVSCDQASLPSANGASMSDPTDFTVKVRGGRDLIISKPEDGFEVTYRRGVGLEQGKVSRLAGRPKTEAQTAR